MMQIDPERLKLFLLDSGIISKKEVEDFAKQAAESGRYLGDLLIAAGSCLYFRSPVRRSRNGKGGSGDPRAHSGADRAQS